MSAQDPRRIGRQAIALAIAACATACVTRPAQRPEPAHLPTTVDRSASGATQAPCASDVRRAARTYVGFSANMSLDDFELAAFEAERILAGLGVQLCALTDAQDRDGSLRAAVRARALEVTSIIFTRDDAGGAAVRVRVAAIGSDRRATVDLSTWLLELTRTTNGWQVVSATPQHAAT